MSDDHDDRYYRKRPDTDRGLRQFLKMESGAYSRASYIENYATAIAKDAPKALRHAEPCDECDYVATTDAEVTWHEHRNPGHECHPGRVVEVVLCRQCGNPLDKVRACRTTGCPYEGVAQL